MSDILADLKLTRLPKVPALQAYDSADGYLLKILAQKIGQSAPKILLLNDHFGAILAGIARLFPAAYIVSSSDSIISQLASVQNLRANQLAPHWRFVPSTELAQLDENFDIVLGRVPKQSAYFVEQLCHIGNTIKPSSAVLFAAMQKHLPKNTHALLRQYLGESEYFSAYKKARIFCVYPVQKAQKPLPPAGYEYQGLFYSAMSNVFARGKLDIGSALMLAHLDKLPPAARIVDLGCGNGILGINAQRQNPAAQLVFIDCAYMAVASCARNYHSAQSQLNAPWQNAQWLVNDGLAGLDLKDEPLILLNPPFHQQHQIGLFVSTQLIAQSARALAADGQLWLVGNAHLGYPTLLARFFEQVTRIAHNGKFVLLACSGAKR